ncbi:sensor histidine kinase [Chloroflexota bacterium]
MAARSERTRYAPAERARPEVVDRQARLFQRTKLLGQLSDSIPNVLLILNRERQIVHSNQRLLELAGLSSWEDVQGRRPGEALNCVHASETRGGCGTTEFCRTCGAVKAILESQRGRQSVKECRILTRSQDALELLVWATPHEQAGELFTIFAAADMSHQKRRQTLERVFFHDVLNTAGSVFGYSELLVDEDDLEDVAEISEVIYRSSKRLIEEIQAQRELRSAERGELELSPVEVSSLSLVHEVTETYSGHQVARDREIHVDGGSGDTTLVTDPVLARRVLGNMLKNALEATPPGGVVTLSCVAKPASVLFLVHNPSFMPRDVQLQVFQRSFSTKGAGRGIGTYSIKLFGEKYLGGSVWFRSERNQGTTFCVELKTSGVTP